jgi:hypothetical protein
MLLAARMDTEAGNQAVADGTMHKLIEGVMEHLKPEAAYFTHDEGDRACLFVFDMKDASQMPSVAQPFFLAGAKVSLQPVMNLDDLQTGLASTRR